MAINLACLQHTSTHKTLYIEGERERFNDYGAEVNPRIKTPSRDEGPLKGLHSIERAAKTLSSLCTDGTTAKSVRSLLFSNVKKQNKKRRKKRRK